MGACYSTDHIAEDHIHIDITCNIDESQQKYRIRTISKRLLAGGGGGGGGGERGERGAKASFTGPKSSPLASAVVQKIWSVYFLSGLKLNVGLPIPPF